MLTLVFSIVIYLLACKVFSSDNNKQHIQMAQRVKSVSTPPAPWTTNANRYSKLSTNVKTTDMGLRRDDT